MEPTGGDATHLPTYVTLAPTYAPTCLPTMEPTFDPTTAPTAMEMDMDADIDVDRLELWQHDHDEQGEHRGWTRRGSHSEDDERIAEGKHYGWSRKGRHNTSQDGVAIVDEEDDMSTFTPSTEPTAEPTTEPTSEPSTEPTATEPTIPPQMSARAKNGAAAGVDDEKMLSWMQPWWSNEESVEVEVEDAWLLMALLSLAMMICVAGVYRQWSSRKGIEYRPIPDNCKVSTAMAYGSTLESNNV